MPPQSNDVPAAPPPTPPTPPVAKNKWPVYIGIAVVLIILGAGVVFGLPSLRTFVISIISNGKITQQVTSQSSDLVTTYLSSQGLPPARMSTLAQLEVENDTNVPAMPPGMGTSSLIAFAAKNMVEVKATVIAKEPDVGWGENMIQVGDGNTTALLFVPEFHWRDTYSKINVGDQLSILTGTLTDTSFKCDSNDEAKADCAFFKFTGAYFEIQPLFIQDGQLAFAPTSTPPTETISQVILDMKGHPDEILFSGLVTAKILAVDPCQEGGVPMEVGADDGSVAVVFLGTQEICSYVTSMFKVGDSITLNGLMQPSIQCTQAYENACNSSNLTTINQCNSKQYCPKYKITQDLVPTIGISTEKQVSKP